ncbi:MAG: flagellar assembly protein FliW [Candidatus Sericytochromatia bacterium]
MTNIASVPALQQLTRELTFIEKGLLGFESMLRYELTVYDPETTFYWLRSKEDNEVAFIVMEPCWLLDDYSFDLGDEDMRLLNVQSEADVFLLVVCTIPENPLEMTANLLGPLVFHRESNLGRQLILDRHKYPVRFPVFQNHEAGQATEQGTEQANGDQPRKDMP